MDSVPWQIATYVGGALCSAVLALWVRQLRYTDRLEKQNDKVQGELKSAWEYHTKYVEARREEEMEVTKAQGAIAENLLARGRR